MRWHLVVVTTSLRGEGRGHRHVSSVRGSSHEKDFASAARWAGREVTQAENEGRTVISVTLTPVEG